MCDKCVRDWIGIRFHFSGMFENIFTVIFVFAGVCKAQLRLCVFFTINLTFPFAGTATKNCAEQAIF